MNLNNASENSVANRLKAIVSGEFDEEEAPAHTCRC